MKPLLAGLSTAIGLALLVPLAQAQTLRAALVQDRDAPGRAPYQLTVGVNPSTTVCPNSFYCLITFPPLPAGQRLVVTHASAEFTNGIAAAGLAYVAGPSNIFGPRLIIPPGLLSSSNRTVASGPVGFYVEPGTTPVVIVSGSNMITSNSMFATLVGYLVTVP